MDLIVYLGDNYRIGGAGDSMLVRIVGDVLSGVRIGACTEEKNSRYGPR